MCSREEPQLLKPERPRVCAWQEEKPQKWEALALESNPAHSTSRKSPRGSEDPAQPKLKKITFRKVEGTEGIIWENRGKNGDDKVSWGREYVVHESEAERIEPVGFKSPVAINTTTSSEITGANLYAMQLQVMRGKMRGREIIYLGQWFSECVLETPRDPQTFSGGLWS